MFICGTVIYRTTSVYSTAIPPWLLTEEKSNKKGLYGPEHIRSLRPTRNRYVQSDVLVIRRFGFVSTWLGVIHGLFKGASKRDRPTW